MQIFSEKKYILQIIIPVIVLQRTRSIYRNYCAYQSYLLGLLAKIKCSICSYQLNLWYALHGSARV